MSEVASIVNLELFSSIVVGISIAVLSIFVYIQNKKSWTNRLFFLLSLNIIAYIFVNFLSLHPPIDTPQNQLFWIRIVMFTTSFIGPLLVLLVYTFPQSKITLRGKYITPLFALMASSAIASITPLVFKGISYPNGKPIPEPGLGMPIFFLDFVGLFLISFAILVFRYLRSSGVEKKRISLLLGGIVASFSLMGITTVIFVAILKTSDFVFFGPLSTIFLVVAISYAIVRYKLFDVRMVATEAFTFVMWIAFSINLFTSGSRIQFGINIILLTALIIFGIFLIRGTRREITQLERLSQAKSDFVSLVAHQLRTPLTAIKGFVSMVLEGSGTEGERKDWLNKTLLTNERLIRLVSDILDVSRIEDGRIKYNFQATDIVNLLDSVVSDANIPANDKGLKLLWTKPDFDIPQISADEIKLRQVIMNLVDNGIKYTEKGWVSVRILHYKDLQKVRIVVQDTGLGMSTEDRENLFGRFVRGKDGRKSNTEGMGIGLYVAKHIVTAHRGKIWAESEGPGTGSKFYIELPVV